MQQNRSVFLIILFLLASVVAACGGGGASGSGAAEGVNSAPIDEPAALPGPPRNLNAGLKGKLFMTSPDAYIEFDLATGTERILRPKDGPMSASADGQELALVNSRPPDLPVLNRLEELVFFGRDGRQTGRFLKEDGFGGRPLISPDKQTVLVEWHSIDLGDEGGVSVPTVFRRDGSIVRRFMGYGGYAWLPDGRLLLSRGDSIFITSLTASAPTLIKRFPNDTPLFVRPSPDGTKIALSLGDASLLKNHTFIMNLDGSNLRQISTSESSDAPADFSPDGNSLLIGQGSNFAIVGPGFVAAGCAELYVVPINLGRIVDLTAENLVQAVKLRGVVNDSGEIREKVCGFSTPSWRAVSSLDASVPGTPLVGTGINRGLSGSTIYGFASELYRTNLATGETVNLNARAPNTPYPSLDSSEIVFYDRGLSPGASRREAVLFLNSNGLQQNRIDVLEGFSGALKFSPDKSKIAADWHNIDQQFGDPNAEGDEGGANIINVFSRDFTRQIARFTDFTSFEWLPDGRLLLSSFNEIWIAPATLDSVKKVATLSDPIGRLAVSRDGQKLAFNMLGNVWVSNLSSIGANLSASPPVRLTDSARLLGKPEFSPDGKVVIVNSGDSPYQAWAVPVGGERVPVMNVGISGTSAFPLKSIEAGAQRLLFPSTSVWWR